VIGSIIDGRYKVLRQLGAGGMGAVFEADGKPAIGGEDVEYRRLYEGFRDLVAAGRSAVDLAPLRLVADAFLCGRRRLVAPFDETGHG
jgi:hypothetical protein